MGEIFQLATDCVNLFTECRPLIPRQGLIEEKSADFNIWAAGLKALSEGLDSLDHRLRDREDVRQVIVGILENLKASLELCATAELSTTVAEIAKVLPEELATLELEDDDASDRSDGTDKADGSDKTDGSDEADGSDKSDESDGSDSSNLNLILTYEGPFSKEINDITFVLDQLYRVSFLIQQSGNKYRYRRADGELQELNYSELDKHLQFIILFGQEEHLHTEDWNIKDWTDLESRVKDRSKLNKVHERLIRANIIRRNRICCATGQFDTPQVDHGKKAQEQREIDPSRKAAVCTDGRMIEDEPRAEKNTIQNEPKEQVALKGTTPDLSIITPAEKFPSSRTQQRAATKVGSTFMKGPLSARGRRAPTEVSAYGTLQEYPRCPVQRGTFLCPYCAHILTADYSNDLSRWRGHVQQDIMPYTCVIENCTTPYELYINFDDWMAHLRDNHSHNYWVCNACPGLFQTTEELGFQSSKEWEDHVCEAHGDMFPKHQLSNLARLSKRSKLRSITCPLCGYYDSSETDAFAHIAFHLHGFALRALPWGDSPETGKSYEDVGDDDEEEENEHEESESDESSVLSEEREDPEHRGKGVSDVSIDLGGIVALKAALNDVNKDLSRLHKSGVKEIDVLSVIVASMGHLDFDKLEDAERVDTVNTYIRALLRIHNILDQLLEEKIERAEQEIEELRRSLQEECIAFDPLLSEVEEEPQLVEQTADAITNLPNTQLHNHSKEPATRKHESAILLDVKNKVGNDDSRMTLEACDGENRKLLEIQEQYKTRAYTKGNPAPLILKALSQEATVEDVEDLVSTLRRSRNSRDKKIGRVFYDFGQSTSFLTIAPSHLRASITGSLVILIQLMQQLPESMTDHIVGSLRDLKSVLQGSDEVQSNLLQLDNKNFSMKWCGLYISIVRLICAIMDLLLENLGTNRLKVVIFGSSSKSSLLKSAISERRDELRRHYESFLKYCDFHQNVKKQQMDRHSELQNMMQSLLEDHEKRIEEIRTRGDLYTTLAQKAWAKFDSPNTIAPETLNFFWSQANTAISQHTQVIQFCRLNYVESRKYYALIAHFKLRAFLRSPASSSLLVRDDLRLYNTRPIAYTTATSSTAARLVESYRASGTMVVITAFCSLWRSASIRDVPAQLIAQMIVQFSGTMQSDLVHNCRERFGAAELEELCGLLNQLLRSLPAGSNIFCVIDSLDTIADSLQKRFEAVYLVGKMREIQAAHTHIVLHMFITTARGELDLNHVFPRSNIVNLGDAAKTTPISRICFTFGQNRKMFF